MRITIAFVVNLFKHLSIQWTAKGMKKSRSTKLLFKGIVQGVGFRPTIYRIAKQLQTHGYVLNKGSEVEVVIDTNPEQFLRELYKHLPISAKISSVRNYPSDEIFETFAIRHSSQGNRQSLIPVDAALCDDCRQELFDATNRRFLYPFTNCTVCGARFSLIEDVPYDRERTAMNTYSLCSECKHEYATPDDRRYHAQTISCPQCGPAYTLYDGKGENIGCDDPIQRFADMIDDGLIGVIKSWGGMHLCCTLDQINRFRVWYHRPQKAFAIMVKDLDTAKKYAKISPHEESLLQSHQRPIVLVKKKRQDLIAPGLGSIGIFLPYSGTHYILFSSLSADALIMTSANFPGEPMIIDDQQVFSLHAEAYLLHNRPILNRIDDSVIKPWRKQYFFLRKSRGFTPEVIGVPYHQKLLSVGAGENVQGAISTDKMLYLTQYIGHAQYYQTLEFLRLSLEHLIKLTMSKPSLNAVAMDHHPRYETRLIAQQFCERYHAPLFEIQHHHAHAASLLLDCQVDESIVLVLDGLGYGDDGTFWGGEILRTDFSSYDRLHHLQPIPLIGGDKAAVDPRRVIYALLQDYTPPTLISDQEKTLFNQMMKHAVLSSSFGRILDALSCYLGICCKRTYAGEPALKLEHYLAKGQALYPFEVASSTSVVDTSDLFKQLHEMSQHLSLPLSEKNKSNLSYSFVTALLESLTQQAIYYAVDHGISSVGVTGGVSYNLPIIEFIRTQVTSSGLQFLTHHNIPNGDGGIAAGQNIISAGKL